MMLPSIAFVGAGPTTIYTLQALMDHATEPFTFTIFEQQPVAGRGSPYRPGWNDPAMLSNIASLEIPPLRESLMAWLGRQPERRLLDLGIDPRNLSDRAFYPRLALGQFFKDQLDALVERALSKGVQAHIRPRCRVLDAQIDRDDILLTVQPDGEPSSQVRFDHLVLATGHQWPVDPEARPGYFLSPWPASALADIPACEVGIRGSSLTAIDAAVTLALSHGEFSNDGRHLTYVQKPGADAFHMTMMSRKGLLPEADFYHPVPYEPLKLFTPRAINSLLAANSPDLLDQVFDLFKKELYSVDPVFAARIGLPDVRLEDFSNRYFADRLTHDPFKWAQANLAEAADNYAHKVTQPWRYAILRMHEVIAPIVPELDERAFTRFMRDFKPVFVDEYATVPHQSIERLLALHRAGKLDLLALGDTYWVDGHRPEGGAAIHLPDQIIHFPVFIDATGQRPLGTKEFPFQSLRKQGVVRDVSEGGIGAKRGIAVDDQFHPISQEAPVDRVFCLSLPFILGRHPFIQGITSSHEMGEIVGAELAAALGRTTAAHCGRRGDLPAVPSAPPSRRREGGA
jgi:uncharacterized NAD(P)/FAD-binding protein YdhS